MMEENDHVNILFITHLSIVHLQLHTLTQCTHIAIQLHSYLGTSAFSNPHQREFCFGFILKPQSEHHAAQTK